MGAEAESAEGNKWGEGLGAQGRQAVRAGFLEEVEEDDTWWPILAAIKLWLTLAGIRLNALTHCDPKRPMMRSPQRPWAPEVILEDQAAEVRMGVGAEASSVPSPGLEMS